MSLISQKEQARLIRADQKYMPSKLCVTCGLPTGSVAERCLHCLERAILAEELVYAREWFVQHPDWKLEVGHDKHRLTHLALLRARMRDHGWCGEKITQLRKTRVLIPMHLVLAFPPEIVKVCSLCLETYKGMDLYAVHI
jgi:hypothetical protein